MAETAYLASALVTGVLLVSVWVLVSRLENWRQYDTSALVRSRKAASGDDDVAVWIAGFLLAALVGGGGAVLLVSNASLAASIGGSWVALVGLFGALLGGYVLWGTYSSARHRGYHSAQAALLSAWVFGSLFVVAIAVKLVLTGG